MSHNFGRVETPKGKIKPTLRQLREDYSNFTKSTDLKLNNRTKRRFKYLFS